MTIKNFEVLKKQLQELHPILNAFNSETVQLRIVELIFGAELDAAEPVSRSEETPQAQAAISQTKRSNAKAEAAPPANKARSARPGSTAVLNELADEGFFDERRLLKDIVEHAKSQNARKFFTATAT